jgi:hypothetical protein
LPTEAAPPQHGVRDVDKLVTLDEDAVEIGRRALFSTEELEAKVGQEMKRRVEAGLSSQPPLPRPSPCVPYPDPEPDRARA